MPWPSKGGGGLAQQGGLLAGGMQRSASITAPPPPHHVWRVRCSILYLTHDTRQSHMLNFLREHLFCNLPWLRAKGAHQTAVKELDGLPLIST